MNTKVCKICGVEKPTDEFYSFKSTKKKTLKTTGEAKEYNYDVTMNYCKECHIEKQKYRMYGVCKISYANMLAKQKGSCAICKCTLDSNRYTKLAIDHDHKTGFVRGLLCSQCNTGLGQFKDSIERLDAAIQYLKKSKEIVCSTGEPVAA